MKMDVQTLLESMDGIALIIDRELRIQHLGQRNWQRFWQDNGGGEQQAPLSCRPITDAFTVGSVRDTFRQLLMELFEQKRGLLHVDYRCDAPEEKRWMRLSVTPILPRDERKVEYLLYQSILLDSQPRARLGLFDVPATGLQRPGILRICCMCAKVASPPADAGGPQNWVDAEDYYALGGKEVSMLSHGFCEPCASKLLADDRAERAATQLA